MNFRNLEKANYREVEEWLKKSSLNLTDYQKRKLWDDEIIRFSPFEFYKNKKSVTNIWLRFSIIFLPIIWVLLFIFLPLTFILTGSWGYGKKFNWILNWMDKVKV